MSLERRLSPVAADPQSRLLADRAARPREGLLIGDRQRHGDLAIVLLAELTTILPGHADRMSALLGKPVSSMIQARIVPRDHRKHEIAPRLHHRGIGPVRLRDEMMQRLMRGSNASRLHPRRHRRDALAIAGLHQPRAIRLNRRDPVGVAQSFPNLSTNAANRDSLPAMSDPRSMPALQEGESQTLRESQDLRHNKTRQRLSDGAQEQTPAVHYRFNRAPSTSLTPIELMKREFSSNTATGIDWFRCIADMMALSGVPGFAQ